MNHDVSYKLLFSHARMVEDLLKGFVHEEWVGQLDFATLEKVSGSYVSDDLREREDDIIWRVRWGQDWLYVYLLIEFQSSVDRHMAVRILTYLGLLYQDLIRQNQFTASGRLPPVLPVVLYNGATRWSAATDIAELIERIPGGLERYLPRLAYLLLDEGALDESPQLAVRNLAAALFKLEKSREPARVGEVVGALAAWLRAPEQNGLRRSFAIWINRVLLRARLPGVTIPETEDLQEMNTMLAERVVEWTEEWKQQGLQQGLQQEACNMLQRLLTRRFGPLAPDTRARLEAATLSQLEHWAENIFDAATLEDVFKDNGTR